MRAKAKVNNSATIAPCLSEMERRFVEEYFKDPNGSQAYKLAKPGCKDSTARTEASKLLAKPHIASALAALRAEQAKRTEISADRAVKEAWAIATADPRELMEYRVGCCPCCWGKNFGYQRTDAEYKAAEKHHARALLEAENDKQRRKIGEFDPMGGPGFDMRKPPNPECPACAGEGKGRTVFKDTRTISPAAASLFAGVKETKEGIEVKLHSKDSALDKVFRHLGLYNDKIQLTLPTVVVKDFTGKKGPTAE